MLLRLGANVAPLGPRIGPFDPFVKAHPSRALVVLRADCTEWFSGRRVGHVVNLRPGFHLRDRGCLRIDRRRRT